MERPQAAAEEEEGELMHVEAGCGGGGSRGQTPAEGTSSTKDAPAGGARKEEEGKGEEESSTLEAEGGESRREEEEEGEAGVVVSRREASHASTTTAEIMTVSSGEKDAGADPAAMATAAANAVATGALSSSSGSEHNSDSETPMNLSPQAAAPPKDSNGEDDEEEDDEEEAMNLCTTDSNAATITSDLKSKPSSSHHHIVHRFHRPLPEDVEMVSATATMTSPNRSSPGVVAAFAHRSPLERSLSLSGLSAKMRLKKHRLLVESSAHDAKSTRHDTSSSSSVAATGAAASVMHLPQHCVKQQVAPRGSLPFDLMHHRQQQVQQVSRVSPPPEDPNSALHRLAEAAERKQEEEMMEVEAATAVATAPPPQQHHLNPFFSRQQQQQVSRLPPPSLPPLTTTTATPSPDSAIHSAHYSPSQSPTPAFLRATAASAMSAAAATATVGLSRNNSDASQYSTATSASPLSPSRSFSPAHSPILPHAAAMTAAAATRHAAIPGVAASRHLSLPALFAASPSSRPVPMIGEEEQQQQVPPHLQAGGAMQAAGISRQQLINSPCPVCGDKISGFHYGIFSCESCKGFFKRTVQNKKNYVCLRGAQCPVSIATRKKCPACRFDKCLRTGMKLEAIREDRTRGGRSTYQCSYTLPAGIVNPNNNPSSAPSSAPPPPVQQQQQQQQQPSSLPPIKVEEVAPPSAPPPVEEEDSPPPQQQQPVVVPPLLQEIMDVEHLWFSAPNSTAAAAAGSSNNNPVHQQQQQQRGEDADNNNPDSGGGSSSNLTIMADRRLYKLVKWCKSLPLFKNILIDDQIALLINAWCELLVFSCCFRSLSAPEGVIRVSNERTLDARSLGGGGISGSSSSIGRFVEKMCNFTDQLRRLRVDYYEYVSMKVIVLLTSDASGLKEPDHVRDSQEKVARALQVYTAANYPRMPAKFAEMLLRIPELQRVCQAGKEMLCPRQDGGAGGNDGPGFNLLMELLRGDL